MQVAIVGLAPSTHDQAPFEDPDWETWGLPWDEDMWPYLDRLFEIHPLELLRHHDARRPPGYEDRLKSLDSLLYMQKAYSEIPNALEYPVKRVSDYLGVDYFNSSISYIMALAMAEGAEKIGIWGVDMVDLETDIPSYLSEFAYQRPNMEYLIGFARGKGIDVYIPPESPLVRFHGEGIPLGTIYPSYPNRYGYLEREMHDKEIESIANKMIKGKKAPLKKEKSKDPTDAAGWLRKAYVDHDPADGAPKVGNMGYV